MDSSPITIAVIGLGSTGQRFARAASHCSACELVALADHDDHHAHHTSPAFAVPYFTDMRQMLLNHKPQAVLLAIPPTSCPDVLQFCAAEGIAVMKVGPLGRSLSEAAGFFRLFQQANLPLGVGPLKRFTPSYQQLGRICPRLENITQARGHFHFHWGGPLGWRGDFQAAGGGAMLELGYPMIDMFCAMFGLPETVFALAHRMQPPLQAEGQDPLPPHETDDLANLLMRYPNGATGSLQVSRLSGPLSEGLTLLGSEGSAAAGPDSCILRSNDGTIQDHFQDDTPPLQPLVEQIGNFCEAVSSKAKNFPGAAIEQLHNHAVIEAAYLSARTGQPESPRQQLQIHGLSDA